ncbi:MAG TPA: DUF4833 domain-containing protein [Cyanophyceae cyanobacterium]
MLRTKNNLAIVGLMNIILLSASSLSLAESNKTQTVFYVDTSGSTGHVNYDIHLNSDCSPISDNPVYNYYKKSDGSTRQLNNLEQEGYSIASQSVSGKTVNLTIGAFQHHGIEKSIAITTSKLANGTCQTRAFTTINGTQTQLAYAHVEVNRTQILGQTVGVHILNISLVGTNQRSETVACSSNCRYGL